MRKIEDWIKRNGTYPERLYLQCDGGPDNTNKYTLAMFELLVSRQIVKSIVFTRYSYDSLTFIFVNCRLLTGHTHEGIDALFGTIYNSFKGTSVETLVDYANCILRVFTNVIRHGFKASVEDLYCVPDYKEFLKEFIDSRFSSPLSLFKS